MLLSNIAWLEVALVVSAYGLLIESHAALVVRISVKSTLVTDRFSPQG